MEPTENPDSGRSEYDSTPFGDNDTTTHVQPVPDDADDSLPGEQPDPRC